jgi:uncharacterized membrane protein
VEAEPTVEEQLEETPIDLGRIAWLITTICFLVAGVVLLLSRRYGYSEVTFAVAVAAGINLF